MNINAFRIQISSNRILYLAMKILNILVLVYLNAIWSFLWKFLKMLLKLSDDTSKAENKTK